MPNRHINTIIISIFFIFEIINKVLESLSIPYLTGTYACMIYLIINSYFYTSATKQDEKKDYLLLFFLILYIILHSFSGETSKSTLLLIIIRFFFLIRLKYVDINTKFIGHGFLTFFIVLMFLDFPLLISNLYTLAGESSFSSIFRNPNTLGVVITLVTTSTFVFINNKKIRSLSIPLLIMGLMACKSRNAVLFMISAIGFYYILKTRFAKYVPVIFTLIIGFALYYLMIIEPQSQTSQVALFGKESGSSGRSLQIILTMAKFPLTFFGVGNELPNEYSMVYTGYPIHCFYINTLYSMGIVYLTIYLIFIYQIFKKLNSKLAKAFLLSSHIHFMFEPGMAYSLDMQTYFPILFATLQIASEKRILLKQLKTPKRTAQTY